MVDDAHEAGQFHEAPSRYSIAALGSRPDDWDDEAGVDELEGRGARRSTASGRVHVVTHLGRERIHGDFSPWLTSRIPTDESTGAPYAAAYHALPSARRST